ncbi:hypothetical protein LguiA_002316 [Lonicera macranthoides]
MVTHPAPALHVGNHVYYGYYLIFEHYRGDNQSLLFPKKKIYGNLSYKLNLLALTRECDRVIGSLLVNYTCICQLNHGKVFHREGYANSFSSYFYCTFV